MTSSSTHPLTGARIGVDLDNTIVCYDGLFHRLALEQGLIPENLPQDKNAVRDFLRKAGREDAWTAMQGEGYGPRMSGATAFAGVIEFFQRCLALKLDVFIVSHKTKHPYAGPKYDLHESALAWLKQSGITDSSRLALPGDRVFLEPSKQAKIQRISDLQCTWFIDDLPELLGDATFPAATQRVLFDPMKQFVNETRFARMTAWCDVWTILGDGLSKSAEQPSR